jgi:hypothetical protein
MAEGDQIDSDEVEAGAADFGEMLRLEERLAPSFQKGS